LLDHINDHHNRRLEDNFVCPDYEASNARRQSCDLQVIGAIHKAIAKEFGALPKDADRIAKSIQSMFPLIRKLAQVWCESVNCFPMDQYLESKFATKLGNLMESMGFPTPEHKAYMQGQRAKLTPSDGK